MEKATVEAGGARRAFLLRLRRQWPYTAYANGGAAPVPEKAEGERSAAEAPAAREETETELQRLRAPVMREMRGVDAVVRRALRSEVELIRRLARYILAGGGKRLRPLSLLLATRLFGYRGEKHLTLAAILEFIHTATLLHDDVVDASLLRRGRVTANRRWGNQACVLVGDFLYSRAFQMMVEVGSIRIMEVLADTTNAIAEGEVRQLAARGDPELDERTYLQVVRAKTAKLFEAAGKLGAILCDRPAREEQALAGYGMHLGTAYQLVDDALDYNASAAEMGKNPGDDLAEGKVTLPLLYALRHGDARQRELIRAVVRGDDRERVAEAVTAVASGGGIAYTVSRAESEAAKAESLLQELPRSPYREALCALTRFVVKRRA